MQTWVSAVAAGILELWAATGERVHSLVSQLVFEDGGVDGGVVSVASQFWPN